MDKEISRINKITGNELGVVGSPKYTYGDVVEFTLGSSPDSIRKGHVCIVDMYGTFFQNDEPSYDIMGTNDGEKCLFKHISESYVLGKVGEIDKSKIWD